MMALLGVAHDLYRIVAYNLVYVDLAGGLTDQAVILPGMSGNTELPTAYAGSVIGIAVASNAARTAGSATFDVTINGTKTGLTAVLNAANTQYASGTQARGLKAFVANDRIGVKVTTTADWAPTTADIEMIVFMAV